MGTHTCIASATTFPHTFTFPSVSEKTQTYIDGKNLRNYSTFQKVIVWMRYIYRIQCSEALPTWRKDEVSKLQSKNGAWGELEFKEFFQVTFHDTWSGVSCMACVPMRCGSWWSQCAIQTVGPNCKSKKGPYYFPVLYDRISVYSIVNFPLSKSSHSFPEIDAGNYQGRAGPFASPIIMQVWICLKYLLAHAKKIAEDHS